MHNYGIIYVIINMGENLPTRVGSEIGEINTILPAKISLWYITDLVLHFCFKMMDVVHVDTRQLVW